MEQLTDRMRRELAENTPTLACPFPSLRGEKARSANSNSSCPLPCTDLGLLFRLFVCFLLSVPNWVIRCLPDLLHLALCLLLRTRGCPDFLSHPSLLHPQLLWPSQPEPICSSLFLHELCCVREREREREDRSLGNSYINSSLPCKAICSGV